MHEDLPLSQGTKQPFQSPERQTDLLRDLTPRG